MTRPTGLPRQQISVQELLRRARAEGAAPPPADRVEERVRAAVAVDEARRRSEVLTWWLIAGAVAVTALSAFAVISFVVNGSPGGGPSRLSPELPPATSNPVTFTGTPVPTETVTLSTTTPETATVTLTPETFQPPYGSPYGGYFPPGS